MFRFLRHVLMTTLIVGSAMAANGCYHIKGGSVGPTPPTGFTNLPSGAPTPTPSGNCQSQNPSAQIVEVSPEINPTKDPTYGNIGEYVLAPPSGGYRGTAAVIRVSSGAQLQFANIDTVDVDSAVGLGTGGFPSVPHTFPAGAQKPIGTAIGSTTWSTGRMGVAITSPCFSQTFTVPTVGTGTLAVYFGDLDRYNFGAYRNVIVVSAGAARPRRIAPLQLAPRLPPLR